MTNKLVIDNSVMTKQQQVKINISGYMEIFIIQTAYSTCKDQYLIAYKIS